MLQTDFNTIQPTLMFKAQNKTAHPQVPELPERFIELKKGLIKPENYEKVKESYKRLLVKLDKKMDEISNSGASFVPEVKWQDIKDNDYKIPASTLEKFKERGCIIVKNVVDRETATNWFGYLEEFVTKHPEVSGYPLPKPSSWFVYWNRAQTEARSHPEIVQLMKTMGQVWNYKDDSLIDLDSQVVYADKFRIRYPGEEHSLMLHLDSGSMERWEDPMYRSVYEKIFEGDWEDYDPFCLDQRPFAKSDLYEGQTARPSACSSFRSLQGWLSLSDTNTGEGTIRFLPNMKEAVAYMMLRPFFWKDEDIIDLETSKFPGALPGSGQFFPNKKYFKHLKQEQSVIGIPKVEPGDYVFWHCDLAHKVDKQHIGQTHSSVFYHPQVPLCPYNIENLIKMRKSFEKAVPPPDFQSSLKSKSVFECEFPDHGAKKEFILSDDGLRALGFKPFDEDEEGITEGQRAIRKMSNDAILKEFGHF